MNATGVSKSSFSEFKAPSRTLRTTRIDVISSSMISVLIVAGTIVGLLLIAWLVRSETEVRGTISVDQVSSRGEHAEGLASDIEPPGVEDVEQLQEATLSESLEAVTDAAKLIAVSFDDNSASMSDVNGVRQGDRRPPGPLQDGVDFVPRFERWELRFQAKDIQDYASQIDFYNIELGCIGNSQLVDYATEFSSSPKKRSGKGGDEKRLYFMWRTASPLVEYDRQLLGTAGVRTYGRQLLKFIPKELEERLLQAERSFANLKGRSVTEIAKTVFESQSNSFGFEFAVVEQRYRLTPLKDRGR